MATETVFALRRAEIFRIRPLGRGRVQLPLMDLIGSGKSGVRDLFAGAMGTQVPFSLLSPWRLLGRLRAEPACTLGADGCGMLTALHPPSGISFQLDGVRSDPTSVADEARPSSPKWTSHLNAGHHWPCGTGR